MTTPTNVETVHRVLAAITERDLPRLLELVASDIEWRSFFAALLEGASTAGTTVCASTSPI